MYSMHENSNYDISRLYTEICWTEHIRKELTRVSIQCGSVKKRSSSFMPPNTVERTIDIYSVVGLPAL